jgi:hypothetical protein
MQPNGGVTMSEITEFLHRHLAAIFDADIDAYHATTTSDLTIYEWHVTPHRVDGWPFHDFMLAESQRPGARSALDPKAEGETRTGEQRTRYDLANYHEQRYGDMAVCSYTMLLTAAGADGVRVRSYNESRVITRVNGEWKVVHVHKSPAWSAPFQPPG